MMDSSTLAPVLSYILTKMVERNDKIPLDDSKRTVFHAQKAPLISLQRYLERVLSFSPCSNSCFIIALIYIDRIIQNTDFLLNSLSVHRMLITSVMVATKFFDDETFNNSYYAKVGGLQVNEVNQLEYQFLCLIDFSLTVRSDIYDRYHCELVKHAKANGCIKASAPVSPLRSKLSHENLCFKSTERSFHPLSRSASCLVAKSTPPIHATQTCQLTPKHPLTASQPITHPLAASQPITHPLAASQPIPKHPLATSQPIPISTSQTPVQTPAQIRSICETLVVETVKNTTVRSQLMLRVTELLSAEEKTHRKLSPSCIKTMCAKLALEHNLPASFIAQATLEAERLECGDKNSPCYQSGFDYTARDMLSTSGDNNNASTNANGSSINTNNGSNGEEVNPGTSTTGAIRGRGASFSTCTPTYPSNHHIFGNRLLGVI